MKRLSVRCSRTPNFVIHPRSKVSQRRSHLAPIGPCRKQLLQTQDPSDERQHQDDSTFFLFASVTQGSDKSNNLTPPPPSPSQLRSKMRVPKAESSPSGAWSLLKQVQSHIGLTIIMLFDELAGNLEDLD